VSNGPVAALNVAGLIAAVFLCVTLHEIGHATMARRFGIRTQDITLLPIGGVARLRRIPEAPRKELLIAVASPLVNVVIAAVLCLGMLVSGESVLPVDAGQSTGEFLRTMLWFQRDYCRFQYDSGISDGRWPCVSSNHGNASRLYRRNATGRRGRANPPTICSRIARRRVISWTADEALWSRSI